MTSIVYYISAYKEQEWVARLANRIHTNSDFICIHFDKLIGKQTFEKWKKLLKAKCPHQNIRIISEFRCKYGSYGLVKSTLNAIEYYRSYDYDYFINLTGDEYPLKPIETLKKELNKRSRSSLEFFKLPFDEWFKGGFHRLQNKYYFYPLRKYPYARSFSLPRLAKRIPCGLEPYGGRGNLCLQKKHADYILDFVKNNPSIPKFFRRVWGPDEILYQTILLNSPFKSSIINDSIDYFDYSEGVSHPKTLTKIDLEKIKSSGKFFARKFNVGEYREILDIIDRDFIG